LSGQTYTHTSAGLLYLDH